MALIDEIYKRIKEEIEKDPAKMGYAGKSDQEIMDLINAPIITEQTITHTSPPRAYEIIRGIADAPNVVTSVTDISEAKKAVVDI